MSGSKTWITRPIRPMCEVLRAPGKDEHGNPMMCDLPTSYAYPAMGGGWMGLCDKHAAKHLSHCTPVDQLIRQGEVWE